MNNNDRDPKIGCVIPVYNEAPRIAKVLQSIPNEIASIIVVNDASTDETETTIRNVDEPRVTLITHSVNQGVGGAVISGYRKAVELGLDIVVKIDSDGQMDPSEIPALVEPLRRGDADYTKGVRFRNREVLRRMPVIRFFGNLVLSFLTKAASGYWHVFDPTNGFTAIHRLVLSRLNLDSLSRGYFFETDMLIHLYRVRAAVHEVETTTRYGSERSRLSPFKCLVTFPWKLFRAWCARILWRYFLTDFSAVSLFLLSGFGLFGFGTSYGLYNWISNAMAGVKTPAGTVMLAALPVILGFQLLLQAVVLDVTQVPQISLQRQSPDG